MEVQLSQLDLAQLSAIRSLVAQADGQTPGSTLVQNVMTYLHQQRRDYHWVGIYKLETADTLVLGPYCGPVTDHVRIPVGKGVCGTAVAENKNQIVDDVRELTNYLACNIGTRSEIVVLIREPKTRRIIGQIDVDGSRVQQFDAAEEFFLEQVAELLAAHI